MWLWSPVETRGNPPEILPVVPTQQNEHLGPSAAILSHPVSTEGHSTGTRLVHGLAVSVAKRTLALPSAYHGSQSLLPQPLCPHGWQSRADAWACSTNPTHLLLMKAVRGSCRPFQASLQVLRGQWSQNTPVLTEAELSQIIENLGNEPQGQVSAAMKSLWTHFSSSPCE